MIEASSFLLAMSYLCLDGGPVHNYRKIAHGLPDCLMICMVVVL